MHVIADHASLLFRAFGTTLLLSIAGGALAAVLGLTVGIARMSPVPFFQRAGATYVEIIRNTPLTVVFFMIVFVLPQIGVTISSYTLAAVVTLGIYTAAFVSEAVRAGINTVGRGQAEASRALGLSFTEGMRYIIVPQALRAVVPPLANVWIALVKNTSVAAGFGVLELTASGQRINFLDPGSVITALLWIAAAYLIITLGSAAGFRVFEKRMAITR
ncbi:amino acid ABC transporter permease (plasmid) [Rhodococcus qingshengii]|uniref:amino acid ABC transporter permease n=1 Tax=Rhodococcus qingshengii TaxID=334542 RepID=UPI0007E53059|nr:amino acid ABC transporter permease [Rhodococcus qingshengii]BCF86302.1 amino acid ABC transporter permease [Rhodococcus qingshengii]